MQFRKVLIMFSFLLLVSGYRAVYSQGGIDSTGNGGMHTIQGRIYMPNGRTPDAGISIKLESLNHRTASIYTDRNGGFAFKMLSPGNYTVVVEAGENYLVAREYFTIDAEVQGTVRITPIPKVFNVPIYLQFKPNSPLKNEVINAKFAHIPKQALELCQKGLELNRSGKTDEAIKAFRLAIAAYPQFVVPHTEIGKIYLKKNKVEEAFNILATAIAIDPKDFESKLNYGIALMHKKDTLVAEKELRAASDLDRTAVTPHLYLGLLFMQSRNLEDAQKEFEAARSLKGDKDFPLVHRYLGGIYWAKKEYRMAAEELEKYVRLAPDAKDVDQTRKAISDLKNRQN